MSRNRFTGGPDSIGAQMKRVNPAIWRDFPLFSNSWNAFSSDRVESSQPFEHRKGYAYVRLARENARIERFGLGAVDDDKVRPAFRRGAAGKKDCEREKRNENATKRPVKSREGASNEIHRLLGRRRR